MAFEWGKTDNLPSTRIKYDLEGEHWMRAFNKHAKQNAPSYSGGHGGGLLIALFSLVIHLFALLFYFAFMLIVFIAKGIVHLYKSNKAKKENKPKKTPK